MKEFIWKHIARFLAQPRIAKAIIRHAQKTPYCHLPSNEDPSYMARWWVFNPYSRVTNKPRWGWLCPVSIRVHHIRREDYDRAMHDHPWNARTIILDGWYLEKRPLLTGRFSEPDRMDRREWLPDVELKWRRPGDTAALKFGEYHTIVEVADGGVYTLFFSSKWRGVWGFWVTARERAARGAYCIGVKVPWREYLGIDGHPNKPEVELPLDDDALVIMPTPRVSGLHVSAKVGLLKRGGCDE